jgi:hypothetical protein
MNQKEEGGAYQPTIDQKPNSRSLSNVYQDQDPSLDSSKRRRLFENSSSLISDITETKLIKVKKDYYTLLDTN